MAETAAGLIDTVLRRVRDPNGVAHSRAFVRLRLSDVQRLVNGGTNSVVASATLTTAARKQFYQISTELTGAIKILQVIEGDRPLSKIDWRSLQQIDRRWHRRTGERFEAFSLIGRDYLIVYPAKTIASSVAVLYTKLTTALSAETTPTDLPDVDLPLVVDMATAIILAKARMFDPAKSLAQRIEARLKERSSGAV